MASSQRDEQSESRIQTTVFTGPGLVCSYGFALDLKNDEQLKRFDRQMDFLTFQISGPAGSAVIYEGNAPQSADKVIDTGQDFPSKVAIHLDGGGYTAALSSRILTGPDHTTNCSDHPLD